MFALGQPMRALGVLPVALITILAGSIGSVTDPELVDPRGDIEYESWYVGARDQDQVDVEAAWMDYDPAADSIQVHIQVPTTVPFDDPSPLFSYRCELETNLTVEQQFSGRMVASWSFDPREPQAKASLLYFPSPKGSPNTESASPLPHTFELVVGEPGFYVWHIEREPLQLRAAEAIDFYTFCSFYQIHATTPEGFILGGSLLGGVDHGFGKRSYAYGDLRPAPLDVPEPDDSPEAAATSSSWVEEGATSALGVLAALGVLSVVALCRRKR